MANRKIPATPLSRQVGTFIAQFIAGIGLQEMLDDYRKHTWFIEGVRDLGAPLLSLQFYIKGIESVRSSDGSRLRRKKRTGGILIAAYTTRGDVAPNCKTFNRPEYVNFSVHKLAERRVRPGFTERSIQNACADLLQEYFTTVDDVLYLSRYALVMKAISAWAEHHNLPKPKPWQCCLHWESLYHPGTVSGAEQYARIIWDVFAKLELTDQLAKLFHRYSFTLNRTLPY